MPLSFRAIHILKLPFVFKKINITQCRQVTKAKMVENLPSRENPIVLKLESPEFHSIFTQEVKDLRDIFDKYQYEIRVAGGAVRDLLLGKTPTDLDFATTATPQQMKDMFTTENIRMINLTGEKHGTITPRINDKENFEVTTLRIDVVTDGRRAEVEYTTDWKLDANRRDLTINSMFLGFDGSVYDYFFGYDDLMKRRVSFVGDADTRIKEDYLRIMRYFRFYGKIADKPANHEDVTLQTIGANVAGLNMVSGERVWTELKKILQGNFICELINTMIHVGVGKHIGLPNPNLEEFNKVCERSEGLDIQPVGLLAALLNTFDDAVALHERLKFSSFERDLIFFIVEHRADKPSNDAMAPYKKLIFCKSKLKRNSVIEYVKELLKYRGDRELLNEFVNWEMPLFPVNGAMLKANGVPPGKDFGFIVDKLREHWIENDYKSSTEELVTLIPNILDELNERKKNKVK